MGPLPFWSTFGQLVYDDYTHGVARMRFVVPGVVFIGALACFWAALTGKRVYRNDPDNPLGPWKPASPWLARFFWTFCGLFLLFLVWSSLDHSAQALR